MYEVVQVSQDTQQKSEKAVALLPPKKAPPWMLPWGGIPVGRNSHWEWNPSVLGAAQRGYTKFCTCVGSLSSALHGSPEGHLDQEIQVSA